ncbi:hypothetical protein QYE76_055526 [Lolium multiflorum]|uniref:Uncharacterized protein n=1 Tax=Lolium multiflorum TaxID=4521 RepID=A0AAD8T0J4_LOLMU|nr:hypothetical protein QYE76_055526 [Lolium multiflorum]
MAAAFARSVNARGRRPPDATIPGEDLERRSTKPKEIKSGVVQRGLKLNFLSNVTDLEYIASNNVESGCLVKCLSGSFSDILDSAVIFSELLDRFQTKNVPGVLVDLSGLVTMPFVSASRSILCYGDESLHKVCFDVVWIVATVTTVEILPMETILRSITLILSQDTNELSNVRDADYDFSMGACFHALHSSCPVYIVKSSAADIVNVFPRAKLAKDYAYDLQLSLNSCIKFLSPDNHYAYPLKPEMAIQVVNPKTSLFVRISTQVISWIPWICKQATKNFLFSFDVLPYFEALQTVMLLRSYHPGDTKLFEDESRLIGDHGEDYGYPAYVDPISLLKRMWSDGHASTRACLDWKLKCLMVQVFAKIGDRLNTECHLEVLELAVHCESADVQNEVLMSLLIIVLHSGPRMLAVMFKKLE